MNSLNTAISESSAELSVQKRILFQNSDCIVINKLTGEAAQGAAQGARSQNTVQKEIGNLPKMLKNNLNKSFVQAAHRIDVPVTGCIIFALNKKALTFLYDVFAGKNNLSIEKIYWAVVEKPSSEIPQNGKLVHWIETKTNINKSFAYNEAGIGRKKASLCYKVLGEGDNYLFVEVKLLSGRHHQIRAQFAASGLYIKGDVKYGAKRGEKGGCIRLHARSLVFPNPSKISENILVTANPPVMDNLWEAFPI
ncbi:MAG: RNA pseudouridine synthase [Treponema sp.]|nr:RNA pseudouridine synthase [Treponema sp.]